MDERNLLKLCLICSVIGLVALFFGVQLKEAKAIEISEINKEKIGEEVIVEGRVTNKYYNGEHLFFDLEGDKEKIDVVIFQDDIEKGNIEPEKIKESDKIRVTGKIEIYNGELEIIGNRVTKI